MKLFWLARGFIHRPTHNGQPPSVRLAAFPRQGKLKEAGRPGPPPFIFRAVILRFPRMLLLPQLSAARTQHFRYSFAIGTGTTEQLFFRSVDGLVSAADLPILLLEKEIA